jgi:hypothetical protein
MAKHTLVDKLVVDIEVVVVHVTQLQLEAVVPTRLEEDLSKDLVQLEYHKNPDRIRSQIQNHPQTQKAV